MSQYRHSRSRRPEDFVFTASQAKTMPSTWRGAVGVVAACVVAGAIGLGVGYWLGGAEQPDTSEYIAALEHSLQVAKERAAAAEKEIADVTARAKATSDKLTARNKQWASEYENLVDSTDGWLSTTDGLTSKQKQKLSAILSRARTTLNDLSKPIEEPAPEN